MILSRRHLIAGAAATSLLPASAFAKTTTVTGGGEFKVGKGTLLKVNTSKKEWANIILQSEKGTISLADYTGKFGITEKLKGPVEIAGSPGDFSNVSGDLLKEISALREGGMIGPTADSFTIYACLLVMYVCGDT